MSWSFRAHGGPAWRGSRGFRAAVLSALVVGCGAGGVATESSPDASPDASHHASTTTAAASGTTASPVRLDPLAVIRAAAAWNGRLDAAPAPIARDSGFAVRSKGGASGFREPGEAFEVTLPREASGATTLTAHDDPDVGLDIVPEAARPATGELVGSTVVYREAFDGVDVVSLATGGGVEELRVVHAKTAAFRARYRLKPRAGVASLRIRDERVEALDREGRVRIASEPVFAVDATGARRSASLELVREGDDTVLVVSLDAHDLRAPIVVDPGWVFTKTMLAMRSGPTLSVSGDKALIVGSTGSAIVAELYDLTTKTSTDVTPASGYPKGLSNSQTSVVLASGKVLVTGGYMSSGSYTGSTAVFDPASKTWSSKTFMSPRGRATATLLSSGKVLVAGGSTSAGSVATAQLFDESSGAWTTVASMATARSSHRATLLPSGKVLVTGGGTNTAEIFSGTSWTAAAPMGTKRSGHVAELLADGRVLVAGGYDGSTYVSTAEIYDPATDKWTAVADMSGPRGYSVSGRLPSGRVLAAGGATGTTGGAFSQSEVFDPVTKAWKAAGNFSALRDAAFASLPSGQILTAGGNSGSPSFSSTTAMYLYTEGAIGDAATLPGDCASGLVADKVCCSTACTGQCQACDVAGSVGTCVNVTGKPHGSRPSCAPYACNGAGACATTCSTDAQCDPGYWCSGSTCVAKRAQGTTCTASNQCGSGFCVDGYCCNSACTDQCARCDAAASPGTCSPTFGAPVGDRPECAGFGAGTKCGIQCNGADTKACHYPPTTTPCSANGCDPAAAGGAEETHASTCDGSGGCNDVPKKCGPYVCGTNACKSSCAGPGDCVAGFECVSGVCTSGSGPVLGDSCTTSASCPSGTFCTDGVCCTSSSCAPGLSCATATKKGYCAKLPGTPCASSGECGTSFCVDGVCCDRACNGQCEACNGVGTSGTCTAVVGAPRNGRPSCAAGTLDPCLGRACDGLNALACDGFVGASVACKAATCVDSTYSPAATCNGSGACGSPAPVSCSPYACDTGACRTTCVGDEHCASGFVCTGGACTPGVAAKLGDPCTDASTCPKGAHCTDGVCCTDAICGAGLACNTPKKKGTCAKAAGIDCKADAECGTGVCQDGVCCDRACPGQCEACDVPGLVGTCSAVKGAPHGARPACAVDPSNVCASASCDGSARTECAGRPGAETTCREPSCVGGTATPPSRCDGSGACVDEPAAPCGGYACEPSGKGCRTSCAAASDCVDGYDCQAGKCTPTANKCTDDGAAVVAPDGKQTSCAPTRCKGGKCIETCTVTEDCASGLVCGGDGKCTAPPSTTDDGGGCSVGSGAGSDRSDASAAAWLVVALAAVGVARRRRSSRGSAEH